VVGCVFSGDVFPGARPLCFQEVDAVMKDRRENTLFLGSLLNEWISVPRFCCLWTL